MSWARKLLQHYMSTLIRDDEDVLQHVLVVQVVCVLQ
jgi:hypothetical protein